MEAEVVEKVLRKPVWENVHMGVLRVVAETVIEVYCGCFNDVRGLVGVRKDVCVPEPRVQLLSDALLFQRGRSMVSSVGNDSGVAERASYREKTACGRECVCALVEW